MTTYSAYLVFFYHRKSHEVVSADIYSEPTPTCAVELDPVPLMAAHGASYEAAHAGVVQWLRSGAVGVA